MEEVFSVGEIGGVIEGSVDVEGLLHPATNMLIPRINGSVLILMVGLFPKYKGTLSAIRGD